MPSGAPDAVVVGSGPNGLAAAVALARAGCEVVVFEAADSPGGGARTSELTRPGFLHDVCSAIHPLAAASPCLRRWPLGRHGLTWIQPEVPLAHPLEGEEAAALHRGVDETAALLGDDGEAWAALMGPLVRDWAKIESAVLGPPRLPRHPLAAARFGLRALRSARGLVEGRFSETRARALVAGLAGHSLLPLERAATAGFALVLGVLGHAVGWPFPRGGAAALTRALIAHLEERGGEVVTGRRIERLRDLPPARAVLLDLTPRQVLAVAGESLPRDYRRRLEKYRYGPGAFKIDWALSEPVPWTDPICRRAGTVHLGGTFEEIAEAEERVARGGHPDRPFVLLAQHSLFDPSRAPAGRHTAWAYCHVPNGSTVDMCRAVEAQVERYAPGFREIVLERATRGPRVLEAGNANLVGGDINGGIQDLRQILARPILSLDPYSTPRPDLFLCSSSTPPGGGVHGMCGWHAARSALRRRFREHLPEAWERI